MKESIIGELTARIEGYEKIEVNNNGYICHTYPAKCFQLIKVRTDWEKLFVNTKFCNITKWHIDEIMKLWGISKVKTNSPMYQLRSIIKNATQEGMVEVSNYFKLFPDDNEIMMTIDGKKRVVCRDGYNRGGWARPMEEAAENYRFMSAEEQERKKWQAYVEATYKEEERLHRKVLAAYRSSTSTAEQRQKLEAEYNAVKMRVYHIENPTYKGEALTTMKFYGGEKK